MARLVSLLSLTAVLLLVSAGPASARAAIRYASPDGTATTVCNQAAPCKLTDALKIAGPGDQIVVMPGDHHLTEVTQTSGVTILGQEGQPRPTIHSDVLADSNPTLQMEGGELRDLEFEYTRTNTALILGSNGALRVERVVIRGLNPDQTLIRLSHANPASGGNPSLIDSSHLSVGGEFSRAISIDSATTGAVVQNTTALATGGTAANPATALYLDAEDDVSDATVRNTLLRGERDIDVRDDTAGTSTVAIDYSAFRPGRTQGVAGAIASGTHNYTADPPLAQLIDASGHLVSGSPLINAGTAPTPGSAFDIDRQARTLGSAPDIGADEAFLAPSAVTGDAATGGSTNNASAAGVVNPNGLATTYRFEYGTTTAYGASTGEHATGDGLLDREVREVLAPLAPGTTYHYRLVATNAAGSTAGADRTFTTAQAPDPPPDYDFDGIPDATDPDDDNDGVPDAQDAFPLDPARYLTPSSAAADTINGSSLDDLICGLGGNDTINGLQGHDTIFGDACDDKQRIGSAQAADGNDTLSGSEGNDTLYGAGGRDKLDGGAGNDRLFGGAGNDSLTGAAGNDSLKGDSGNDTMNGGAGKDKLDGGAGNDKLNGGASKNSYAGGAGNDTITAANGQKETVDCGAGKKDSARVDRTDKVKGCERVKRAK